MNTRHLLASLGSLALIASPMIASAATASSKSSSAPMKPASTTPAACKSLTGKKLADCVAKHEVAAKKTSSSRY